jgi:hypothetical protein
MCDHERIIKIRVEIVKKSGRMVEFASEIDREYPDYDAALAHAELLTSEKIFQLLEPRRIVKFPATEEGLAEARKMLEDGSHDTRLVEAVEMVKRLRDYFEYIGPGGYAIKEDELLAEATAFLANIKV